MLRVDAAVLNLYPLTPYDPLAVCNDGTPAGVYWGGSLAPSAANDFVLYLEGGG